MTQQDTTDFITAFVAGALIGAGTTLLLRPAPARGKERILKELAPYRRKLRKDARRAREGFREGAAATADLGEVLRDAGKEALQEFRDEIARIVADAREDLARSLEHQVARTKKALRRRSRRLTA
ncbi:MAG TPA: YtxH domain-containing protein [Longimicrobiales bacterium]